MVEAPLAPALAPRPAFGRSRLTPVQRAGLAYERKVLRQARAAWAPRGAEVLHNPWIRYFREKTRYCCPDIVILTPGRGVILECKLSWTSEAEEKVLGLYLPLAEELWPGRIWATYGVCKHWRAEAGSLPLIGPQEGAGFRWILWG